MQVLEKNVSPPISSPFPPTCDVTVMLHNPKSLNVFLKLKKHGKMQSTATLPV